MTLPRDPFHDDDEIMRLVAKLEDSLDDDWAPYDLADIARQIRNGTWQPTVPAILHVDGGIPLFYAGRINMLFGESGGGKTWIGLGACAETARAGGRALFIDYEDTPAGIAERLVQLELTDEQIGCIDYRNPTTGIGYGIERDKIGPDTYQLVVIDSTGEAMASGSVSPNADDEVALWFRKIKELTKLPGGPAVIILDHVPKDKDAPPSYAIGSQRKKAAVTGASYRCDTLKEPAKGKDGKLRLTVAKDRPGNRAKGTTAAEVDLITGDNGAVELHVHQTEAQEAAARGEKFRPTVLMERVSRWLELNPGQTVNQIVKGVDGRREFVLDAITILVDETWVNVIDGPNRSRLHTVDKSYRELDDPGWFPVVPGGSQVVPGTTGVTGQVVPATTPPPLGGGVPGTTGTGTTGTTPNGASGSRPPEDPF